MKRTIVCLMFLSFMCLFRVVLIPGDNSGSKPKMAPVNPDFLKYLGDIKREGQRNFSVDGHPLGYIPPPVDLSHVKSAAVGDKRVAKSYSAKYDLRQKNKLTPVKNQGDCGACWTFGSFASLESSLMPSEQNNFSEQHLNTNHGFDSPKCEGGNAYMSTAYLARWDGPIDENDVPYPYTSHKANGYTLQKHVQQVIFLPCRSGYLDNDTVKYFITNYGALYCAFYYDSYYYNSATSSYYNNYNSDTNHAVAIVGWDDNYPISNFDSAPPGKGAFIARNSWGTDWGEKGYFYISYYDTSLGYFTSFNNAESINNYETIYQYDPLGSVNGIGYKYSKICWGANIFTAANNESLAAVSFYTTDSNVNYEIYIYKGVSTGEPRSGTLATTKTGSETYPGYHTVELGSLVSLSKGDKFSVVIQFKNSNSYYPLAVEYPYSDYSSGATANSNESYYSHYGTFWYDLTNQMSNANVCIKAFTGTQQSNLTVTSPNGGETWNAGSSHNITWTYNGGSVKIRYSTNNGSSWSTVTSSTANDGKYSWTVPNVSSSQCLVRISETATGTPSDTSDAVFTITSNGSPASIALNRTRMDFTAVVSGSRTGEQEVWISNSGGGILNWSVSSNASWLSCTPTSGNNAGIVTVSVNPSGLAVGSYTGTITISDSNASNSPQTVTVHLTVKNASQDLPPFGDFATPISGSTVYSSIPVTGWVLDDVEVMKVKIYNGSDYFGDAVFVEGVRPDVEQAYPGYPKNYRAGWGYMLLTNFLPNQGNGTYIIHAKAVDSAGHQVTLGFKTIKADNNNAVKPFGAIDTPTQGGTASGSSFINWGWALTPQPKMIPTDGSTINVYVDGVNLGHPTYNIYRSDIATLLPGYANSNNAAGYFYLDTTAFENGVHTIQWTATDNQGVTDGIGSRYFSIQNPGNNASQRSAAATLSDEISQTPVDYFEPIKVKKGYQGNPPLNIYPDDNGTIKFKIKELERIEVHLPGPHVNDCSYSGYMKVGSHLRTLPVGSTLDAKKGIFYWQPGIGFQGRYLLVFVQTAANREMTKKSITVEIVPKTAVLDIDAR